MGLIRCVISIPNKSLLTVLGGVERIPFLTQGDLQDFEFIGAKPTGQLTSGRYEVPLDLNGKSIEVSLYDTAAIRIARQTVWTWNAVDKKFEGTLGLNTSEIATYLGAGTTAKTAIIRIYYLDGADRTVLIEQELSLKKDWDAAATVPSPVNSYYTAAQIDQTFARLRGLPGQAQTWVDADNLKSVTGYVNAEGQMIFTEGNA